MAEALRAETATWRPPLIEGDTERMQAVFTDLTEGASVDPGTLVFTLKAPDEEVTEYTYGADAELHRYGAGIFYVDFDFDQEGVWRYRFEAGGTHTGVCEGMVVVKRSGVATD